LTKDMTVGSPMKHVISFTIPLFFGNLFQQFYSMVDTIIVGQLLGSGPLAAVGSTGSINFFILGFCLGICSGFTIPVAQRFGSKDFDDLKRYIGNIVWLTTAFALVITVITVVLCRPILEWMATPADIIDDAYNYIVVIFAGIPSIMLFNILSSLMRAVGDSRTPVIFLVLASIVNIGLDYVLVAIIPMGVAGTAWATVISQIVSGVGCFLFIWKKMNLLHISRKDLKLRKGHILRLLGMGIPMGLQTSITAIGTVVLQTAVNSLGSLAVASMTAGSRLSQMFSTATDALGITMSTFGGQNIGARKIDRIGKGLRSGLIVGTIYSVIALTVCFFFGRTLVSLFVESSEVQIIDQAYQFLVVNAMFFIPLTGVNAIRLIIQGMGYSKVAMFAGMFEMVARSLSGIFLVPAFGFIAACFSSPLAWILADAFLIPAYIHVMKHVKQYGY
jgi:putative MATE family efflux protein